MNETYRYARHVINLARCGMQSTCVCFIRPSNQGKSHTAHILSRDANAIIIPPLSVSEQRRWFSERIDNPAFIFDDPSDWYRVDDRMHLMNVLKNLVAGWLQGGRGTKYDINMPVRLERKCCVLLFMNIEQYNRVRGELEYTGLAARLETYMTKHDIKTMSYINFEYADKGYSSVNLPTFKNDGVLDFPSEFINSAKNRVYFNEIIEFEDIS